MARRRRKKRSLKENELPHTVLAKLSLTYGKNMKASKNGAEHEFWLKCTRATANLSSGMEKWLEEMFDEEDDA